MVGIGRLVKCRRMTAGARTRRTGVIALVASRAISGNCRMCASQCVKIAVNAKRRRRPGICCMTARAIDRQRQCRVIGVDRFIIIRRMTTHTIVRRIGVIAMVASRAIACNARMRPLQRVIIVVDTEACRRPSHRCMACTTIRRYA